MNTLRSHREALGLSQSRLARLCGVSRFKICTYELGDTSLSGDEQERISGALQREAQRLSAISLQIDFSVPKVATARNELVGAA